MVDYLKFEGMTGSLSDFFADKPDRYQLAKALVQKGQTIDGYDPENGYIVKDLADLDFGYNIEAGIHYKLEVPNDDFEFLPKKLLVRFAPHESSEAADARSRYAGEKDFDSLSKSVAKNTYILRIADVNLLSGSYYLPTSQRPDYDQVLLGLIKRIMAEHHIDAHRVVFYGNSRGGMAALYYAHLSGYGAVAGDPIVSTEIFKTKFQDNHLLFDYLPTQLAGLLPHHDQEVLNKRYIISNSELFEWRSFSRLPIAEVQLVNISNWRFPFNNQANMHGGMLNRTVPLQLMLINELLYAADLEVYSLPASLEDNAKFDVLAPLENAYTEVEVSQDAISINYCRAVETNFWIGMPLKQTLKEGQNYELRVLVNLDNIRFFFQHLVGRVQKPELIEQTKQADGQYEQVYRFSSLKAFDTLFCSAFTLKLGQQLVIRQVSIKSVE